MTLKEDYYIKAGDQCIKFLGEDDVEYILEPGLDPRTGTDIVIHPTTGEVVTAGHEVIKEGDKVITVPLDNGDWAALKPAWSQESLCKPIIKWVHDVSYTWDGSEWGVPPEWIGEYYYRGYDIHLSETFYRVDHDLNITAYFDIHHNGREPNLSDTHHYGGVWWMFGYYDGSGEPSGYGGTGHGPSPDVNWFYCTKNGNPYRSMRGDPWQDLGDETSSGLVWNKPRICYMDALNDNVCNQSRCASNVNPITPPPKGQPINMIHVHIDTVRNYSMNWSICKSQLQAIDICRQVPTDCETRCYGGRNVYPPMPPYDIMEDPDSWEEVIETWP